MKFKVLAGPCVIESEECVMKVAEKLTEICRERDVEFYFKASFDKANRTSADAYRGLGIEEGIKCLNKVKEAFGVKIVTDIHEASQAAKVAEVADILQIPAFLCRQTDLLVAAAKTGKILNIKKAQFLAPWDMINVVKKVEEAGNSNIMLCERGTSFGYNTLVVDMTGLVEMKKNGYPVIFDATHSVQKPGGNGTSTGGNREYVRYLARAATAVGIDGIFAEVHPDPDNALSDGPNMIVLEQFAGILDEILEINQIVKRREVI
jgi:3-deoxy-8-phosphooctulonate synthase